MEVDGVKRMSEVYDGLGRRWGRKLYLDNGVVRDLLYTYESVSDNRNTSPLLFGTSEGESGCLYYYDANGNISHIVDGEQMITYQYDELNQLVRMEYNKIKCVVICNAAEQFSTRYGSGWYTAGYGIDKETFFQYAEIVLFESYDCVNFLQAGLYNCNLCSYWHGEKSISRDYINYYARVAEKNMTDLGICDFESLRELLLRTSANEYILGDVYFRFQKELDAVIQETDGEQKVYLVLGNKEVVFYQYTKADAVRKDLSIAEAYKRIFPVKARYLLVDGERFKDHE